MNDKLTEQDIIRMQLEGARRRYDARTKQIATSLRDLADKVERDAEPRARFALTPGTEAVAAASQVVHDITWAVANLDLDGLLTVASLVDEMTREAAK